MFNRAQGLVWLCFSYKWLNFKITFVLQTLFLLSASQRLRIATSLSLETIGDPSFYLHSMKVRNRALCQERWNCTWKLYWVRLVANENGWTLFWESLWSLFPLVWFGAASVLAIPYYLSFKPGHLCVASSASILAGAAAWSAAFGRRPPVNLWILDFGSPGTLLSWTDVRNLKCGGSIWGGEMW